MRLILFGYLLLLAFTSSAQISPKSKLPKGFLAYQLKPLDDNIPYARGYAQARKDFDVKAHLIMFRDFRWQRVQTFNLPYDSLNDRWLALLPHGTYEVCLLHPGFDYEERLVQILTDDTTYAEGVLRTKIPYTYERANRYNYIKGTQKFSETMIVRFSGGDPIANLAYLQTFPHERIQMLRDGRYFYFTALIPSVDTITDLLQRQATGAKAPEFHLMIGDSLTSLMERIREGNPLVVYVDPTYFNKADKFIKLEEIAQSRDLQERIKNNLVAGINPHPLLMGPYLKAEEERKKPKPKAPTEAPVLLDENGEIIPKKEE
jgi:hypothetical protein